MSARSHRAALEISAWTIGILLLGLYLGARSAGEIERRQAVQAFEGRGAAMLPGDRAASGRTDPAVLQAGPGGALAPMPLDVVPQPLQSDWSNARITAYQQDSASLAELPVALLRIPRVELEVPVYAELNERNLNRGAAWVEGTATPDSLGNVGIAAHRDGYFRSLQHVVIGDTVELALPDQQRRYRITQLSIVDPTDVSPLHPTEEGALTLVTCYPFYFVGSAPQRYIVRAEVMP